MMPECVVTVLTVEGEIYFNSCCVCNSKVDLVPGTNRGWCKKCRACTSSPNKRYRLSLKVSENSTPVHATIFGRNANELFGCTAYEFFSKVGELNLTNEQVKSAVEKSLLSEVIKISRQKDGGVSSAVFAVPTTSTSVVDCLQGLDTSDPSFSLSKIHRKMKLHQSIPPQSGTPTINKTNRMINSTPLFSQFPLGGPGPLQDGDQMSPIWPTKAHDNIDPAKLLLDQLMDSPPDSPVMPPVVQSPLLQSSIINSNNSPSKLQSLWGGPTRDTGICHSSTSESSYSAVDMRRGKRRRCRVQCVVVDPPTQNTVSSLSTSGNIRPPNILERLRLSSSEDEEVSGGVEIIAKSMNRAEECLQMPNRYKDDSTKTNGIRTIRNTVETEGGLCESRTKHFDHHIRELLGSDADKIKETSVELLENEIDDVETCPGPESYVTIDTFKSQPPIYIEPDVIADLLRSDDSIFDDENDDQNTSTIPETQDFDSFEVDDIQEFEHISNVDIKKPEEDIDALLDLESLGLLNISSFGSEEQMTFNPSSQQPSSASTVGTSYTETKNSSDEDLFGEQSESSSMISVQSPDVGVRSKRISRDEDFEWSKLSQMSSQEISTHFDFRLSETDDEASDCSAEIF